MENENDQVFEADQDVNAFERMGLHSSQSVRASSQGQDAMQAAFGGSDLHKGTKGIADEGAPLLGKGPSRVFDDGPDGEAVEGHEAGVPIWDGERDFEGKPWWNRPSVYWLLPPFALFTMAFGGVVVPRLDLIISLQCRKYFADCSVQNPDFQFLPVILGADNPQCLAPEVQAMVSKFSLYGSLIAGILAAITSPKLGALSDCYGRTKMISITIFGMLMSEVMTILVATYPDMMSVNWILVGFAFDGLGGSFIAAMALSYAYTSDCTVPEKRNVVFGYFHGSLFAGIALGPILAGYIVKATGNILNVFYTAFAFHCIFFVFLLFIVPESLTKERQLAAREKRKIAAASTEDIVDKNRFIKFARNANFLGPLTVLWPTGPGTNPAVRRNLVLIAAVDATMFGVAMGSMTVILLYSKSMFGWDTFQTTIYVSIVNTCRVVTLMLLLPAASRLIRGPVVPGTRPKNSGSDRIDLGIIRTAIIFDTLGYVGYTLVRTGPLFILCGAIAAVGGMGSPTLQAALTKHVPQDKTGQVLGAMGLLHAIARVVAPIVFNVIYAKTVGGFSQTVLVCLAATFGLAFGISWFIRPHVYWDQPTPKPNDSHDEEPLLGNE